MDGHGGQPPTAPPSQGSWTPLPPGPTAAASTSLPHESTMPFPPQPPPPSNQGATTSATHQLLYGNEYEYPASVQHQHHQHQHQHQQPPQQQPPPPPQQAARNPQVGAHVGTLTKEELREFTIQLLWIYQKRCIEGTDPETTDFKAAQELPVTRVKKVMKLDEDLPDTPKLNVGSDGLVVMAKACELFILELALHAWHMTEENRRRTLMRLDVAQALGSNEMYDFLIDIVPREAADPPPPPKKTGGTSSSSPAVGDGGGCGSAVADATAAAPNTDGQKDGQEDEVPIFAEWSLRQQREQETPPPPASPASSPQDSSALSDGTPETQAPPQTRENGMGEEEEEEEE